MLIYFSQNYVCIIKMINKSNVVSSIYSVRKSLPLESQIRKNCETLPKYTKIMQKETAKFKEFLRLIEKGGNRLVQQSQARQKVIDKLNRDQIKLERAEGPTSKLYFGKQKRDSLPEKHKKSKKNYTQNPQQIKNQQGERYQEWKSKFSTNQLSIKFPQLTLVKETLIIQESPINEKRAKQKEQYFYIKKPSMKNKGKQLFSLRTDNKSNKEQTGSLNTISNSAFKTLQRSTDRDIEQWTISKWA